MACRTSDCLPTSLRLCMGLRSAVRASELHQPARTNCLAAGSRQRVFDGRSFRFAPLPESLAHADDLYRWFRVGFRIPACAEPVCTCAVPFGNDVGVGFDAAGLCLESSAVWI